MPERWYEGNRGSLPRCLLDKKKTMKLGEYTNVYSNPQSIKEVMMQRQKNAIKEAGDDAPHLRAKWVEATRVMLGKDQKGKDYTFGRINGLTKKWSVELIRDRYYYCIKLSNSAMVWWGLRKKDKNATK